MPNIPSIPHIVAVLACVAFAFASSPAFHMFLFYSTHSERIRRYVLRDRRSRTDDGTCAHFDWGDKLRV